MNEWQEFAFLGCRIWISGVYKITEYKRPDDGGPFYHAYIIQPGAHNWGDYVDYDAQYGNTLSWSECREICERHADTYEPTKQQLKRASEIAYSLRSREESTL